MNEFYQWIDALWIPVAALSAHRAHRLLAAGFVASGMLMLRLQVELMESIDYAHGIIGFLKMGVYERGLIVYSTVYLLYCIMAHYSPGSGKAVFLAASITMFFAALLVSTFAMVL